MNKVILIGRLGRDPEVRWTSGADPLAVARFSLAVERKYKAGGAERETDWFSCIAFGKTGENISKFFCKGQKIGLAGRLQTGSYEKDGQKIYTVDVIVEEFDFIEPKQDGSGGGKKSREQPKSGANAPRGGWYAPLPEDEDEDLPF